PGTGSRLHQRDQVLAPYILILRQIALIDRSTIWARAKLARVLGGRLEFVDVLLANRVDPERVVASKLQVLIALISSISAADVGRRSGIIGATLLYSFCLVAGCDGRIARCIRNNVPEVSILL